MSDVSAETYDVFFTCANPEHTAREADAPRRTRSATAAAEAIPEGDDDDDDDGLGDDDADEHDDEYDEQLTGLGAEYDADDPEYEEYREGGGVAALSEVADESSDVGGADASPPTYERAASSATAPPARSDVSSSARAAPAIAAGGFSDFIRQLPKREKSAHEVQAEAIEKQSMLTDLRRLRDGHGVTLSRDWTMDDDIDDISFELKRIMLHIDEVNNIGVMRNGLQLACTGIEMLSKRFKLLDLEGWSAEVCRDVSKHDRALGKMYRKYWRRSHASSPEADIALSLVGSMGMFHMRKMLSKRMFQSAGGGGGQARYDRGGSGGSRARPSAARRPHIEETDDDEDAPPL